MNKEFKELKLLNFSKDEILSFLRVAPTQKHIYRACAIKKLNILVYIAYSYDEMYSQRYNLVDVIKQAKKDVDSANRVLLNKNSSGFNIINGFLEDKKDRLELLKTSEIIFFPKNDFIQKSFEAFSDYKLAKIFKKIILFEDIELFKQFRN